MPFQAKIVLDSISEVGIRLITMELVYPLIVHNELLTHRAHAKSDSLWLEFSRNSASNRALPSSLIVQAVLDDPYIPMEFRKSTKGMIAGEVLDEATQTMAREAWLTARDEAVASVEELEALGVHKQWRNRLLGPFQWITTVATANEEMWEHFFTLRDHKDAQPDIADVAHKAHVVYRANKPTLIKTGAWHLPYMTKEELAHLDIVTLTHVSVARCARVSYLRQGEVVPIENDTALYNRLVTADNPHSSPLEHIATPSLYPSERSGNFLGWRQYRKLLGL